MPEFYRQDTAAVLSELNVQAASGLTAEEVAKRQQEYGKNVLPTDEGTNWLQLILGQFKDLMVIILIFAAVVSALLGEVNDLIIILAIVILNAILGAYQEFRAEQALAALSALQVPMVRVRRDGEIHQISAEELVPGDIVLLEEGDRIPADGRLIQSVNLQIEEAALTGESHPVDKNTAPIPGEGNVPVGDRTNMAFMGTSVNYGRGEMVITRTGLKTEIGNIAAMLLQVEEGITPLQRRLNDLGRALAIGAFVIVAVVFFAGLLRNIPVQEMFLTSISLAVAAVPEGLPAIITISLSLGAGRMIRRHVLIRRLPAVETLGSVTTICSDKTGTLTKNEMTATLLALPGHDNVVVTGIGYTPNGEFKNEDGSSLVVRDDATVARFLKAMALSTNAYLESKNGDGQYGVVGDTTEGALLVAAQKAGWTRDKLEVDLPRIGELPFSSDRKAMTTIHEVRGDEARALYGNSPYISITKGAPDKLLNWASYERRRDEAYPLDEERREAWLKQIDKMASQGLRVLGIAYRPLEEVPAEVDDNIERNLHLLGLVGIVDPARPEAKDAVRTAREAGIRTIMITGDHALTAEAIARDLGILGENESAITGTRLDQMSEAEIAQAIQTTSAFARVSPEHKLKLVRVLQSQGQIVAMTGDGVNDAPALKQADIGVAMGITGTDVSKGAAEMVLTDDNFASIVAAVEEGRTIYDNIRKFVKYLLSSNIGEILVMFIALMIGLPIPLLAIQILWVNLVTDGLPAIALGFEKPEQGVMKRKPRPPKESIFADGMGRHILWVSITLTIVTLIGYLYGYTSYGLDPFNERTLGMEKLSSAELDVLFSGIEIEIPAEWDAWESEPERRIEFIEAHAGEAGGLEASSEGLLGAAERMARTMAFTVLAFGQIFHVIAIHGGDMESFFRIFFRTNPLLMWAAISTFVLQLMVIYLPFMQFTFETVPLPLNLLIAAILLASIILFAVEIEKLIRKTLTNRRTASA